MDIVQIKNEIKTIKTTKFGISMPELKKLAQKIAAEDYRYFIQNNGFETFELRLLHAYVLGYARDDIKTLLKYFEEFIPYVNHWAINDTLCLSFKIAREYPEQVWKFLMKYKNSHKEFESRIVSVMLLYHYLKDDYIDKVISVLNNLDTSEYYSSMGAAWAVAEIMGKYPERCLEFLQSSTCHLDKKTYNKSLQKIRESYKVSDEIKTLTKSMKL